MNNLYGLPNENLDLLKSIANYLLSLKIGERMISTREIAEVFGASLGSVSTALNNLEEIGAVTISRRGRLGSFLEKKSYGLLWKVVENGPMVIALTLPTFSKSEGLATAIYSLLDVFGAAIFERLAVADVLRQLRDELGGERVERVRELAIRQPVALERAGDAGKVNGALGVSAIVGETTQGRQQHSREQIVRPRALPPEC